MTIDAALVADLQCLDQGYAWIKFTFECPRWGPDHLEIGADGFCSRIMPVRSGQGPPVVRELDRDGVVLSFSPSLAKRLELADLVLFKCSLSEFDQQAVREFLRPVAPPDSASSAPPR